jgi:DMSO/TMAO reductase YedYZ molybdopterin-dependent catalytic subunit
VSGPVSGPVAGVDESFSPPARIAGPDEGISLDELRMAARNHGMPLEMLSHDVTPLGLHYVLVHYDIPTLDTASWRLEVGGHVERPLVLDMPALLAGPQVTRRVTLECAGNGRAHLQPRPVSQPWLDEAVGTAEWTGTPLAPLLERAGLRDGAVDVVFTGADHGIERGVEQDYERALPVAEACHPDLLVAHTMNGQPLLPQHGAPARLVVPGWYGMAQVKWLVKVTVLDEPFTGYQNAVTYRVKQSPDEEGEPVTRILPRALLRPPGFPDFQTRARFVDRGAHDIVGRAWSGLAPIVRVEVSADGGATWDDATLGPAADPYAWRLWRYRWVVDEVGPRQLCARATDAAGNTQPLEQAWNRQAMANNHVQRVTVVVR